MPFTALAFTAPVAALLAATTDSFDRDTVTPGPAGFIVTGVLGLVVVLLVADMVRRVRRLHHRAEAEAALDAEETAAKAGPTGQGG